MLIAVLRKAPTTLMTARSDTWRMPWTNDVWPAETIRKKIAPATITTAMAWRLICESKFGNRICEDGEQSRTSQAQYKRDTPQGHNRPVDAITIAGSHGFGNLPYAALLYAQTGERLSEIGDGRVESHQPNALRSQKDRRDLVANDRERDVDQRRATDNGSRFQDLQMRAVACIVFDC